MRRGDLPVTSVRTIFTRFQLLCATGTFWSTHRRTTQSCISPAVAGDLDAKGFLDAEGEIEEVHSHLVVAYAIRITG